MAERNADERRVLVTDMGGGGQFNSGIDYLKKIGIGFDRIGIEVSYKQN